MNLTATLTRKAFNEACAALCQEDADIIAETYPNLFAAYFTYNARAADVRPAASPGPAKAREPKASSAPAIDKTALASAVYEAMTRFPNLRSEDYVTKIEPSDYGSGLTAASIMPAVKKACEALVSSKAAYCEGNGRGRRYKVATKAEPEAAAE